MEMNSRVPDENPAQCGGESSSYNQDPPSRDETKRCLWSQSGWGENPNPTDRAELSWKRDGCVVSRLRLERDTCEGRQRHEGRRKTRGESFTWARISATLLSFHRPAPSQTSGPKSSAFPSGCCNRNTFPEELSEVSLFVCFIHLSLSCQCTCLLFFYPSPSYSHEAPQVVDFISLGHLREQ